MWIRWNFNLVRQLALGGNYENDLRIESGGLRGGMLEPSVWRPFPGVIFTI